MDLGSISDLLLAGRYASSEELRVDVALVWANCRQYNGPEHEATRDADAAAATFERLWAAASGAAAAPQQQEQQQQQQQQPQSPAPGSRAGGAAPWVAQVQAVLERVLQMPDALPFGEPVSEDVAPGYFQAVSRPMDLGTVQAQLGAGQYASPAEVHADVAQVWANCRAYNEEGDDVWVMGERVEAAFAKGWAAAGLAAAGASLAAGRSGGRSPH